MGVADRCSYDLPVCPEDEPESVFSHVVHSLLQIPANAKNGHVELGPGEQLSLEDKPVVEEKRDRRKSTIQGTQTQQMRTMYLVVRPPAFFSWECILLDILRKLTATDTFSFALSSQLSWRSLAAHVSSRS